MPPPESRILVIDDDMRVREMLREVLTTLGYEVDVADRGWTGLAKFSQHPADVVMTDLMMPGLDGLQVAATLRVSHPDVPIILITGAGKDEAIYEARRLGLRIVYKPVGVPALRAAINGALGVAGKTLRAKVRGG
jgi:DNA-binding response OmpR family regulator